MDIPRSSFYYTPKGKSAEKQQEDMDLQDKIERACCEFPAYGYRRVTKQLHREGWKVNHKRVYRIMRENELICQMRSVSRRTTNSDHSHPVFSNLIKDMVPTDINQVWVSDITYIRIPTEFVYLSVILDCFSRKVIGYHLSYHLDTNLTLTALRMAIHKRAPVPGCIHHSDQGIQYASGEYVNELRTGGFKISMARRGNPYDNAICESFLKTLKHEEVYLSEYRSMEDAQKNLVHFIEDVYNAKRLHSSLDYRPPNEVEEDMLRKNKTNAPFQTTLT